MSRDGVRERHARSCASRSGGACDCSPTWQANVWDNRSKKRTTKTFRSKAAAVKWRRTAQVALERGEMTADRGPTINVAADAWLAALRSGQVRNRSGDVYKPSAIRGYDHALRLRVLPEIGHVRVNDLTPRDVQEWIDRLVAQGLAPATVDSALTPLRAMYRRAVARGEARSNPTLRIEKPAVRPARRQAVTPAQAAAMLDALDAADRPLWAVAFYAGLRRGELIGLRWADVDLAAGVLRVERGWDMEEGEVAPKSRQGRRKVPVAAILRDHLDEHRLTTGGEGPLFRSPRWVQGTNDRARTCWRDAGLPELTLHEARHTYASLMIAAGVNAKALSTFMGHANIGVTLNLYGHLLPGSEDEAASLLDAYLAREAGGEIVAPVVAHPEKVPA